MPKQTRDAAPGSDAEATTTAKKPTPKTAGPKPRSTSTERSVPAKKAAPTRSPARKGPAPKEAAGTGESRTTDATPAKKTTRKGDYAAKHEPSEGRRGNKGASSRGDANTGADRKGATPKKGVDQGAAKTRRPPP